MEHAPPKMTDYARLLLDSSPDGIWSIGTDGLIVFVNAAAVRMFGYASPEAMIGRNSHDLVHYKHADGSPYAIADCPIYKSFQEGVPITLDDEVLWRADGSSFHAEYRSVPVHENGAIVGGLVTFFDNTERRRIQDELRLSQASLATTYKQIEAERTKLRAIFEQVPIPIATFQGPRHCFTFVNSSFKNILLGGREVVGEAVGDALPEVVEQGFKALLDRVYATGEKLVKNEIAVDLLQPTGVTKRFIVNQVYEPILDANGEVEGILAAAVDVTEQVNARRQVEEFAAKLSIEKHKLEIAKVAAEQANETKSAFLANMSHEIRTPLGAMLGYAELLKEADFDSAERLQFLTTITRNGKALARIIDDILDLAKVEAGKLDVEKVEFSFSELTHEVVELFAERVRTKGISLAIDMAAGVPQRIASDPVRLRQILINIVGNAVKFTDVGGVILRVSAKAEASIVWRFVIEIEDTGIGLRPEQRDKLFEPFVQADNATTRQYGGTGLGLVLSRRLATALGGGITLIDGDGGGGCTFVVTFTADVVKPLPAASVDQELPPVRSAPGEVLTGYRILVADDSPDNQALMRRYLTKAGAKVDLASNGAETFRLAMSAAYDVVLLDIQMPIMDGYEAARSLREAGYRQPIIALTAHAMAEERARTRAVGCDGHLTKPVDRHELVRVVRAFAEARVSARLVE